MVNKTVTINISGIRCDSCDYKIEDVKFEEYDKYKNMPCPKCGANLLTQADIDSTKMLISLANMLNDFLPEPDEESVIVKGSVEMDGTGKVDLVIKE